MSYFKCGSDSGSTVEIDGVEVDGDLKLTKKNLDYLKIGSINVQANPLIESYKGELYIMNASNFYKWNGSKIENIGSLPITLTSSYFATSVVYENEIHLMINASSAGDASHYKWDGTSWTLVSKYLPRGCFNSASTVYNNEIHHMGGGSNTEWTSSDKHYKWDGTSWTTVSTLPYSTYNLCATTYNNEIHIMGGTNVTTKHYKWDGTSWTSVSTLPYALNYGFVVVFDDQLHILGGSTSPYTQHYKWNGTSWTSVSTLPVETRQGTDDVTIYKNYIHTIGAHGLYVITFPMYMIY